MPMSSSFQKRLFPRLPMIVEKFGSPFHIYDERGIRDGLRRLNVAFANQGLEFREYYAVKALPKPAIMDIILSEWCGFDCSSIPELRLARGAGARPEDIMFTSNNTSFEEFHEALCRGGCILNIDDESLIDKIPGRFPQLICFRVNPGHRKTGNEVNTIIGDPVDSKYGVPIESIVSVYKKAMQKGAKIFGLHTMVCSNDLNYRHMVSTARILFEVAADLKRQLGISLEFINMGGGIGIPYRPDQKEFEIELFARACRGLTDEFEKKIQYVPKLFLESGRWVTGPHGVLVNKVINVYKKYKQFIGVEVAMPGLMRVGMYATAYHHCTLLDANGVIKDGVLSEQTVAGSICENCDVLAKNILLPTAEVGDIMITADTGAHGSAMGFNYNGRLRPQELLLCDDGTVRRICRGETYEDLNVRHLGLDGPEHVLSW